VTEPGGHRLCAEQYLQPRNWAKRFELVKGEDAKKKGHRATSVALFVLDLFEESHSCSAELSGNSPGSIESSRHDLAYMVIPGFGVTFLERW
jgi:hypothetical protein